MIIHSYDPDSEPIITPAQIYGPGGQLCDTLLVTFSKVILEAALDAVPCTRGTVVKTCGEEIPVWLFQDGGRTLGIYQSGIGAPTAGGTLIEAAWLTGATSFIMFGSAGCLNSEKAAGKYVVPTAAYRDEGLSYHYAPPADYISFPGAALVEQVFREEGVPFVSGPVWTTDAFYRETRAQTAARQQEGCLAVDMEAAGVQAVCSFYGWRLYDFLMTGDVLDGAEYDHSGLHQANHDLRHFDLALRIARALPDA